MLSRDCVASCYVEELFKTNELNLLMISLVGILILVLQGKGVQLSITYTSGALPAVFLLIYKNKRIYSIFWDFFACYAVKHLFYELR